MHLKMSQTATYVGPTLAQRRYCRPNVGPTLAQLTLLSEVVCEKSAMLSRSQCFNLFHLLAEFDCEGNPSDVVFLLDSSNSIWGPDFELQLRFISHVVRRFRIGPDHMKVAVVTYSDRPVEQFKLLEHKHRIRDAIAAINHDGGVYTHTGDAIHMVRTKTLAVENGGRDNVTKILIMITDGRSYNATATAIEAAIARSEGLHMFVIGVGDRYDVDELYALASQPYGEYIFRARSYRALDRLKDLLAVQACTGKHQKQSEYCTITVHWQQGNCQLWAGVVSI